MRPDEIASVLSEAADAVAGGALGGVADLAAPGERDGQYALDLSADAACTAILDGAGFGWLSEESGLQHAERAMRVIVDPVDGSTNASIGLPWFATSLCAVDAEGPVVSLVRNQALGTEYTAVRGSGARKDGDRMTPSPVGLLDQAMIAVSGWPAAPIACRQARMYGAAALDLCGVADGTFDGYVDLSPPAHGIWDYAAATHICAEAGVTVIDAFGGSLWDTEWHERRTPVAAHSPVLLAALLDVRRSQGWPGDPS